MKKLFESVEDSFLDIENKIKEGLNAKALEQIEEMEDELMNESEDVESVEESDEEPVSEEQEEAEGNE